MKSDKQIKKEVKKELNRFLKEVEVTGVSSPEPLVLEDSSKTDKILKTVEQEFIKEKKLVSKMNASQIANWLINKHTEYTSMLEATLQCDFLNERDSFARYYLLIYMTELYGLLSSFEIDFFSKDVVDILVEKQEVELISILNVLNYI